MSADRRLFALVATVVLVDTAFYAAITPLLPSYVERFDLSKGGAGVLAGAYPAGTLLGALPGGLLAARVGVKPTVVFGLGCMAGASIVFAFAPGIVVLDAARFVQGWGGAASWAGAAAWLVARTPPERRGERIGAVLAAAIVGALLGPVLGGAADLVGPRTAFSGVAVLGAVLAAWALATPGVAPSRDASLADVRPALRDPRVASGMWLTAVPGLLFGTVSVLAPLRLDVLGASAAGIAVVFLVAAALEACVSPVVGRLSDRRGRIVPMRVALAGASVVFVLLPLPAALVPLVALVIVASPVIGVLWAPASALLSDGADAVGLHQGLAFALLNLAWASGQMAGSAGSATLAEATSDAVPFLLLAGLCLATLALLVRRGARLPELGAVPVAR